MKAISTKPKINIPKIQLPKKPTLGIKMPRLTGMINPLRLNK